jgi:alkylmercury lyase
LNNTRLVETTKKTQEYFLEYEPGHMQLMLQLIRQLAQGRPLTPEQVDQHIVALRIAQEAAHQFLREVTERDATDQIVGIMGLSLNDHPHRVSVAGVSLSAWCAPDTLYLPALLQQTVTIESPSLVTHQPIRLRVSPERVEEVHPEAAVISFVLEDPSRENTSSVEVILRAFCNHNHFFASREEGEQWAKGRNDLVLLTVQEGFAKGQQIWSRVFPDLYAG